MLQIQYYPGKYLRSTLPAPAPVRDILVVVRHCVTIADGCTNESQKHHNIKEKFWVTRTTTSGADPELGSRRESGLRQDGCAQLERGGAAACGRATLRIVSAGSSPGSTGPFGGNCAARCCALGVLGLATRTPSLERMPSRPPPGAP